MQTQTLYIGSGPLTQPNLILIPPGRAAAAGSAAEGGEAVPPGTAAWALPTPARGTGEPVPSKEQ